MSRTGWKKRELEAASLLHGKRFPANVGGPVDIESSAFVAQVKARRVFSLKQMEVEAVEIERIGSQKNKIGILMLKRSAGKGTPTPWLICMTAAAFREMSGPLPTETP